MAVSGSEEEHLRGGNNLIWFGERWSRIGAPPMETREDDGSDSEARVKKVVAIEKALTVSGYFAHHPLRSFSFLHKSQKSQSKIVNGVDLDHLIGPVRRS